jgi:hypothetical protein
VSPPAQACRPAAHVQLPAHLRCEQGPAWASRWAGQQTLQRHADMHDLNQQYVIPCVRSLLGPI